MDLIRLNRTSVGLKQGISRLGNHLETASIEPAWD